MAGTNCSLTADILFNCAAPQQGGLGDNRVILINYDDWLNATVTIDATSKEITAITLASGGVEGFDYQVPKSSNIIATAALRTTDGADGFDHSLDVRIQNITQLARRDIEKLRFGKVVGIVKLADQRAQLFGGHVNDPDGTPTPAGVGLRLNTYEENPGDASTGGTIHFVAATPENDAPEMFAPSLIASTFDITGLLTPTI